MNQLINWDNIPKPQVVELKEALQSLVTLIKSHEEVTLSLGFEVSKPIDVLSFNFALFNANHAKLLELGKHLEQIYQSKLVEFQTQI